MNPFAEKVWLGNLFNAFCHCDNRGLGAGIAVSGYEQNALVLEERVLCLHDYSGCILGVGFSGSRAFNAPRAIALHEFYGQVPVYFLADLVCDRSADNDCVAVKFFKGLYHCVQQDERVFYFGGVAAENGCKFHCQVAVPCPRLERAMRIGRADDDNSIQHAVLHEQFQERVQLLRNGA